jgi:hypothetical protein
MLMCVSRFLALASEMPAGRLEPGDPAGAGLSGRALGSCGVEPVASHREG